LVLFKISCTIGDSDEKIFSDRKDDLKTELTARFSGDYENIQLTDIELLPLELQRTIFREISPLKRLELWSARMQKAKASLSQTQIAHLSSIEQYFSIDFFSDTLSYIEDQVIYNWVHQMDSLSVWSKRDLYYLLCTFAPVGNTISAYIGGPDIDEQKPDCNCRTDFYCSFLSPLDERCVSEPNLCRDTRRGCGWFFMSACIGRCQFVSAPG
jgi:hypothetical protein